MGVRYWKNIYRMTFKLNFVIHKDNSGRVTKPVFRFVAGLLHTFLERKQEIRGERKCKKVQESARNC